tara:strand:- start:32 stop:1516 length:1485 start_codon:yes stop_codon:yes gene_type:complete
MADKKIRLLVQAEVRKAVKALNQVEKEQKDIKKQNDGLKKSFAAMGGAIAAAFSVQAIANFTASAIRLGSQTISLERSFRNLGKAVNFNDESLAKFRKATDGTVSDVDLMIQANNAMLLGIVENDDAFAELIDNAQRLAKAVGQDALFGIESLTTGIGRQSKLMLDNLGIVLDTNLAYQKFAEANGKAVKDLDENERKQAFVQAALQSTAEKVAQLGDEELDATDATLALSSAFENLQGTIGKTLQDEVEVTANFFTRLIEKTERLILRNEELKKALPLTGGQQRTLQPLPTPERPDIPLLTDDEDDILPDMDVADETYSHLIELDNKYAKEQEKNIKFLQKLEDEAYQQRIQNNLQMALLSGQSAKDAVRATIQAEMVEAQGKLISSIMDLPFPLNIAIAAGAGAMIDKVFSKLPSFATGGSFVTKGRTTLPIGNGVVVGDNASGMERIDVTPLPSPTSNGNNITINISAPLVDETVVDHIIPAIRRAEKLNL